MMNRKLSLFVLLVLLFSVTSGCGGYHIVGNGSALDGLLPGNIKSLHIPVFINNTNKPNVEGVVTQAVVSEFLSTVEIVPRDSAEATLYGEINSYRLAPVSFTASDVIQEYRLYLSISIRLLSASDDKLLWKDAEIVDYEDYIVVPDDISLTKEAEWEALRQISYDTARIVKERMLEGF